MLNSFFKFLEWNLFAAHRKWYHWIIFKINTVWTYLIVSFNLKAILLCLVWAWDKFFEVGVYSLVLLLLKRLLVHHSVKHFDIKHIMGYIELFIISINHMQDIPIQLWFVHIFLFLCKDSFRLWTLISKVLQYHMYLLYQYYNGLIVFKYFLNFHCLNLFESFLKIEINELDSVVVSGI